MRRNEAACRSMFSYDAPESRSVETNPWDAVEDGDGRRGDPDIRQQLLELLGRLEVAWAGKSVADDRGLERHDGTVLGEGFSDCRRDNERRGHGVKSTRRAQDESLRASCEINP